MATGNDRIEELLVQRIRAKAACDSGAGFDAEVREYGRLSKLSDAIASDLDSGALTIAQLERVREAAKSLREYLDGTPTVFDRAVVTRSYDDGVKDVTQGDLRALLRAIDGSEG